MLQLAGTQGVLIDHYRLQRLLGRGGMSEVYLAYDEHLHRKVALKLVGKGQLEYFERFQHEVALIGSLEHDHILPVFAYGEYNSWCYLVMPYLEYGTLGDKLKAKGPLTQKEAGLLLEQIASALHCAHEHGILHRDVKSSNIFLRDASYAYLADFGLAKEQGGGTDLTQPGYIMGTLEYLAPELQQPFATATPSSDIYALGILLYEMLTGQVPFRGDTTEAICWQHLHEPVKHPSLLQPKLTPAIDQVVLRALAKEPSERFQTPQELAQAYQQAIEPFFHSQPTMRAIVSPQLFLNALHSTKQSALWQLLPSRLSIYLAFTALMLLLSLGVAILLNNSRAASLAVARRPHPTQITPIAHHNPKKSTTAGPTTSNTSPPVHISPWHSWTPYHVGDMVTYLVFDPREFAYRKITYVCIKAHISRPGLEPPEAWLLWEPISNTEH